MATTLITSRYASHPGHYSYAQPPPSPPMEDPKCSLPSISNLLGLADAGSPTSETSPVSQRPSPQPEGMRFHSSRSRIQKSPEENTNKTIVTSASHIKAESRPSSGYGRPSHHRGLPPTPPMSTDASFDGNTSPSSKSVSQFSNGPAPTGHYYETTPPLEADLQRHYSVSARAPRPAPLPAVYAQPPATYPSGYAAHPPVSTYYAAPAPQQPQVSGLFYQRPLPQSFPPPPMVMPASSSNPWQHHHYLNPTGGPSFPQSQDRYICQTCSKAFSRPSSLRIHSHSHTGEKPFKCPHAGCGKAFSVRSNMKRHERGCHSFEVGAGRTSLS